METENTGKGGAGTTGTENTGGQSQGQETEKSPPEKTFSQDEVNAIISERLAKERKNLPSKEQLAAFTKWQAEHGTKPDPAVEAEKSRMTAELVAARAEVQLLKLEAKPEFVEFLCSKLVAGEHTDLEAAAKALKKMSPQYFGQPEVKRMSSSPRLSGGGVDSATTNQIMNKFLRGE